MKPRLLAMHAGLELKIVENDQQGELKYHFSEHSKLLEGVKPS